MKPTKKQLAFIGANWQLPDKQFVAAYNDFFGCSLNVVQWRIYKSKHRLIKQKQEHWTPYQVEYLLANYEMIGNVDIANHFGWSSEKKKGEKKVWKKMRQMGLVRSDAALDRLKHDMGNRGWEAARNNRIKKGLLPHHAEHAEGEIWQRKKCGRWLIKHKGKIVYLSIHLWKQAHGKIPAGHVVAFKDGDWCNCALSNLCIRTRAEMALCNTRKSSSALTFNYVAGILTPNQKTVRHELKNNYPMLIEVHRQMLLNKRAIKSVK